MNLYYRSLNPDSDATDVSTDPFQSKSGTDNEKNKDDISQKAKISSKISDLFGPEVNIKSDPLQRSRPRLQKTLHHSTKRSESEPYHK